MRYAGYGVDEFCALFAPGAVARLVAAGADAGRLRLAVADFSRLDEVRAMAARIADEHPVLDALVRARPGRP